MGILNKVFLLRVSSYSRLKLDLNVGKQINTINKIIYRQKTTKDNPEIPRNVLEDVYSASKQSKKGLVYDKKPFKIRLVPNKSYHWCTCGHSKNQPLCDGSHKNPYTKIALRPVKFQVEEEKDYYLCNCKQTSNRPFCDGTHKLEEIQSKK